VRGDKTALRTCQRPLLHNWSITVTASVQEGPAAGNGRTSSADLQRQLFGHWDVPRMFSVIADYLLTFKVSGAWKEHT